MRRPTALALALATTVALAAPRARAAPPANGNGPAAAVTTVDVPRPSALRLALSPAAGSFMTEVRVRALLDVELQGVVPLAEHPTGPIAEPVVRAWIDLPDAATVLIEVQAPGRVMTARHLDVTGLNWDVAARFAALATAELVRAQLAPVRVRRPRPRVPTPREIDEADRRRPRWVVSGGAHGRVGEGIVAGGPELEIGHATRVVDTRLGARLLGGDGDARLRAAEVGLSAEHHLHAAPWLRADVGASAAIGTAAATDDTREDAGGHGRLAARLGLAARIAPQTWLGLRLEPGVVVGGPMSPGGASAIDGASVGVSLAVTRDVPLGELVLPR